MHCWSVAWSIVLLVSLTPWVVQASCGKAPSSSLDRYKHINKRGAGGVRSLPNEWPWVVVLRYRHVPYESFVLKCSGVIIADRYVLTMNTCLLKDENPKDLEIGYGSNNFHELTWVNVSSINMNYYYYFDKFKDDGLAVLTLAKPLHFSSRVNKICIPSSFSPNPRHSFVQAGFAHTFAGFRNKSLVAEGGKHLNWLSHLNMDPVKYVHDMPVQLAGKDFQNDCCNHPKYNYVCTHSYHYAFLNGDVGGPVMNLVGDHWELVGLVAHISATESHRMYTIKGDLLSMEAYGRIKLLSDSCPWIKRATRGAMKCT